MPPRCLMWSVERGWLDTRVPVKVVIADEIPQPVLKVSRPQVRALLGDDLRHNRTVY